VKALPKSCEILSFLRKQEAAAATSYEALPDSRFPPGDETATEVKTGSTVTRK
jgi:hypothetical protein